MNIMTVAGNRTCDHPSHKLLQGPAFVRIGNMHFSNGSSCNGCCMLHHIRSIIKLEIRNFRFNFTLSNNMKSSSRVCYIANSCQAEYRSKVQASQASSQPCAAGAHFVVLLARFVLVVIVWLIAFLIPRLIGYLIGLLVGRLIVVVSMAMSMHFIPPTIAMARSAPAITLVPSSTLHQGQGG